MITLPKRTTIKEIAKAAGVTHGVVSVVLSGRKSTIVVGEKTRQRILDIAKSLNYKPDILARGMVSGKSFLIGMLVSQWYRVYAMDTIQSMTREMEPEHYSLVIYPYSKALSEEYKFLKLALDRKVDGLLVNAVTEFSNGIKTNEKIFHDLQEKGMPIVELLGRYLKGCPSITPDTYAAGRKVTEHLISLGHKKIAHLTHNEWQNSKLHWVEYDMVKGYTEVMEEAGLEPHIFESPLTGGGVEFYKQAILMADKILSHPFKPTAIVCYTDFQAFGLGQACFRRGVKIPDDLALTGYGDAEGGMFGMNFTTLTTFRTDFQGIGQKAIKMLFEFMDGKRPESITFTPDLIVRGSTQNASNN